MVLYPTGGGTGLLGIWKAFEEMAAMGWLTDDRRPRMVCVQSEGCAPLVKAYHEGVDRIEPWENPQTIAAGLRVPGPFADDLILQVVRQSGGTALTVSDDEIRAGVREMAEMEGVFACPEGAGTLAALRTAPRPGRNRPGGDHRPAEHRQRPQVPGPARRAMSIKIGMHTGPQNCTYEELRRLWHIADSSGFHWISIWDHFYDNPSPDGSGPCFEAVSTLMALAAETRNVRVGALVFCMAFRHPAVLAKAAVTIDHVSNGRLELGLGAGWFEMEFNAFGIPFPPVKNRLDALDEGVQVIRSMLTQEKTTFVGEHLPAHGRLLQPQARAAAAPHLGGRRGGAAHPAPRGPVRRRLERAVHHRGQVPPQDQRPGPLVRDGRAATRRPSPAASTCTSPWARTMRRRRASARRSGAARRRAAR